MPHLWQQKTHLLLALFQSRVPFFSFDLALVLANGEHKGQQNIHLWAPRKLKVLSFVVNAAPTDITTTAASFNENIAAASSVATLGSVDPDTSDTFTYSLVSGTGSADNGAFTVVGNQLQIKGSPDFESKSSYAIRVRTTDQDGLFFEKNLTFAVNNPNEAPTALTVTATNFNENIASGSVVANLGTNDPDAGNTFTYSLVAGTGPNDNGAFSISGNQLKITGSPDYEAQKTYQIRVRTTDQGNLSFEKDVLLSVNNLVEKTSSGVSTTLAPDKDTLELTGTKNIFGIGNQFDNTITGNSGKNKLIGGLGKDTLTGGACVDTFFYNDLRESLLSGFDVITDFAAADRITVGFAFEGDDLIASTGKVSALNAGAIGSVLTNTSFLANNAAAFTVEGLTGTFLALNDGRDGFQADTDALIHLSNYTIGSTTPISII
jgi:Ca2+-binding RTX toxin-like protein